MRKGARCGRARRAQAGMESYRPELSAGGASGAVGAAAAELRERQVSQNLKVGDGKEKKMVEKNGQMETGNFLL